MYSHPRLGRAIAMVFWLLFAAMAVSFWFRNDFAEPAERFAALQKMGLEVEEGIPVEPRQQAIDAQAFSTERNGVQYTVVPLYDYSLQGVVISWQAHDGDYGLHGLWGDHLNIADICVVWGENAAFLDLNEFDFWNTEFTCNIQVGSRELWEQFREDQLSNNHLLIDDESLRDRLSHVEIGDVITVRGQLAEYGQGDRPRRKTSTIRTDRGNGACETLYVNDVRIVGNVRTFWYPVFWYSLWGTLIAGVVWLYGVGRGHF